MGKGRVKIGVLSAVCMICAVVMAVSSCKSEPNPQSSSLSPEQFKKKDALGVYNSSGAYVVWNENSQIVFNHDRKMFRLQTDDQDSFVEVVLSGFPAEDLQLQADVAMRKGATNFTDEFTEDVTVVKVEDDKYWLWCSDSGRGYIVYIE